MRLRRDNTFLKKTMVQSISMGTIGGSHEVMSVKRRGFILSGEFRVVGKTGNLRSVLRKWLKHRSEISAEYKNYKDSQIGSLK